MNLMNSTAGISLLNGTTAMAAALAVFIVLTVILLTFVILLFACKPFRNLFFPTDGKKQKKRAKQENKAKADKATAKHDNGKPKDAFKDNSAAAQPARAKKSKKGGGQEPKTRVRLAYSDSVPTVPLFSAPATTGYAQEEDIMKRTHDALLAIHDNPRATSANTNDYVPTVVIPITNSRDKTDTTTTHEHTPVTHERPTATHERTPITHERPAVTHERMPITHERTATHGAQTKPTVKPDTATAQNRTAKTAKTLNTAKTDKK